MRRSVAALALLAATLPAAAQPANGASPPTCESDLPFLNPVFGWQVELAPRLNQPAAAAEAVGAAEARRIAASIGRDIAALGRPDRLPAPQPVVDRVLAQLQAIRADVAGSAIEAELGPALAAYADFLRGYRAHTTPGSHWAALPQREPCFVAAAEGWTTLRLSADELEAIGRSLIAEARRDLAREAGVGEGEVPRVLAQLRRGEPAVTRDELLAVSRAALDRAQHALPRAFNAPVLPPIGIEPLAASLEADSVAGAYRAAEPGRHAAYVVNLSRPGDRRLMAEVIAFHETLPGHHLAFSLQRSAGAFNSGFVEGWAIYAEYLAHELGLYATPRDRIGMHAKHLWAASRLIVEPGLHVRGWSRAQAIDFMRDNSALSDAEIAVEVDRYLALPGQSLAYMLGADRLRSARRRAEAALESRFDLRDFHDVVLRAGSRPLGQVDADVDAWIARSRPG